MCPPSNRLILSPWPPRLLDEHPLQSSDIAKAHELVLRELSAELALDAKHEVDVRKRIPTRHVTGDGRVGQHERIVVEDVAGDLLEALVYVVQGVTSVMNSFVIGRCERRSYSQRVTPCSSAPIRRNPNRS